MTAPALEKLQVLVIGVDTVIARDVVRLLVEEGAHVMAADRDGAKLARLDRDVGLYRSRLETSAVDLGNLGEVREWEARLRHLGRAPQLIVCCCGAPTCPSPSAKRTRPTGPTRDVALGEHRVAGCPAAVAVSALHPTMFMHAEPLRRTVFDRAISVLRHPTLRGLVQRAPGRAGLGPALPYARGQVREASLRSTPDGAARPRLRLVTPSDTARDRADAA